MLHFSYFQGEHEYLRGTESFKLITTHLVDSKMNANLRSSIF